MSTSSSPNTQQQTPIHFSLSEFQTAVLQTSGITLYHCKHKTVENTGETELSHADVQKYSAFLNDIEVAINLISNEKERLPLEVKQWWVGDTFSVNNDSVTLHCHPQNMNSTNKRDLWRVICDSTL